MKTIIFLFLTGSLMVSCVASNSSVFGDAPVNKMADTTGVTIFLLERDIPQKINRIGTVSIRVMVNTYTLNRIDADVRKKLNELCAEQGANGAYRINDGTYAPYTVCYLLFKYDR